MYITTSTNDMTEEFNQNDCKLITKKNVSICFGCGYQINDQFILRVAPDLEWHAKCLKCYECGQYLDENCTCFVRNGRTYCKLDYIRLFSQKCYQCKNIFDKNDLVMRANNRIYHMECFRCSTCNKQLSTGDEFALKDDRLLCKFDNESYEKNNNSHLNNSLQTNLNLNNVMNNHQNIINSNSCQNITNLQANLNQNSLNNPKSLIKCEDLHSHNDYEDNQNCLSPNLTSQQQPINTHSIHNPHIVSSHVNVPHMSHTHSQQMAPNSIMHSNIGSNHTRMMNGNVQNSNMSSTSSNSSTSSGSSGSAGGGNSMHHSHRKDKTTRVRTVLNEKQLHTLRTCYGANPRPDALMKEQLVEMTGLSPRVIRVWFQNKRCKDKKKTIMIKQLQEQQRNRQTIGHGIPMIATSPVRNDINNLGPGAQVEIQQSATAYQSSAMGWNVGMNGLADMSSMGHQSAYDQMMGFGSDEEDCFDQLSDQGGDDSVSSVGGLDDNRLQQL